jgi:hypothetical protein
MGKAEREKRTLQRSKKKTHTHTHTQHTQKEERENQLVQKKKTTKTEKQLCTHLLEAMDPLLAFTALATHIHHAEVDLPHAEHQLCDTGGARTRAQNILICGSVRLVCDSLEAVEEVLRRVVQLEL